jgi:dipeptidyl aminopeptidase/acylaminoacyl peptidase
MIRRAPVLLWLLVLFAAPASSQTRGLAPADYYHWVGVGEVAMSPAGDRVVFTVTRVVEEENRRQRELWVQPLSNEAPAGDPYRISDPTSDSHSAAWSPDGAVIAFTSSRGDEDRPGTWFLRMYGRGGEAFQVEGVRSAPVWSPDGRWIAYVRAPGEDDDEPDPREGWVAPDAVSRTLDPERFDGRVITSTRYKADGTLDFLPHYSVRPKNQLFVVPAEGGVARQIATVPFDVAEIEWSSDSRFVFFSGDEFQDDERNGDPTVDLWVVEASGGSVRRISTRRGSETAPAASPDGRWLAHLSTPRRGAPVDIHVIPVARNGAQTGERRNLTANWDLGVSAPRWSADGRWILFSAEIGGDRHLFRVPSTGGEVQQVTRGERQLGDFSFSADSRLMAYTATDAVTPGELFVARADGSAERRASAFNDDWIARTALMPAERLMWTVSDGTEIEGWVIRPVGFEPGRSYPLVLKIHGGPHTAYGNTFFPAFHVLSAAGFFVLYTNPRGSSGYGHDFQYATRGRWGIMDKEDLLTGVDAALRAYPEVDPERLGVSGGSYGGFMTNWLTATTDRFRAAVTSRSITNWESWWGGSDAHWLTHFEFFGFPWEQRDIYRRLSPISYVENVTAPTLIIHSENDYRTPIADAEQWFMSLRMRGVPVEMVRYPRSSHGLSRTGEPWLLVDRLERIRSWFAEYLGEPRMLTVDGH